MKWTRKTYITGMNNYYIAEGNRLKFNVAKEMSKGGRTWSLTAWKKHSMGDVKIEMSGLPRLWIAKGIAKYLDDRFASGDCL